MGSTVGVRSILNTEVWYFEDRFVKCDSEMRRISILLIFKKIITSYLWLSKSLAFRVAIRRILKTMG